MKIVLDANIFVSFFLTTGKTIGRIFDLWQNGAFIAITSPQINEEIKKCFQYPRIKKLMKPKDMINLNILLEEFCVMIYPKLKVRICKDPDDNKYLACAQEGKADYLITRDIKHLLSLKKFGKTKIVTPKEFVDLIE
jgi:uncharacterized protein